MFIIHITMHHSYKNLAQTFFYYSLILFCPGSLEHILPYVSLLSATPKLTKEE